VAYIPISDKPEHLTPAHPTREEADVRKMLDEKRRLAQMSDVERFEQTTGSDIINDIKSVAQWAVPFVAAEGTTTTETVKAPGQRGGAKPAGHQAGGLGPGGGRSPVRYPLPAEQQAASKASAAARGVRAALAPEDPKVKQWDYPKTGRGATQWTSIPGAERDWRHTGPYGKADADFRHSKAITQSLDNMRTYLNQSEIARDLAKGTTAAVKIASPLLEFAGYLTGALAVPLIFFDEFEKSGHLPAQLKFMAQVGFQRPLESKDLSPQTRVLIRGNPASIERLWEEGTISDAFYESLTSPDDIASRE